MRPAIIRTVAAAAALLAGAAGAEVPVQRYELKMELSAGGTAVSQPNLVIVAGQPAEVAIEPGDGASYRATIVMEPVAEGKLLVSSAFAVSSDRTGSITATPRLLVRPGERATVEFGTQGAGRQPFRADMTFTPVGG